MTNVSQARKATSRCAHDSAGRPATPRRRPTLRLQVEALEDRDLLAVGALDTTFNLTGKKTLDFLGPLNEQQFNAIAIQGDGKAVAAGTLQFLGQATQSVFAVARFNIDGSLDASFGDGGRVIITFPDTVKDSDAKGIAIDNAGKIVVAGTTTITGDTDFAVARLNTNGTLDTSFSGDGLRTIDIDNNAVNDRCNAVVIQNVGGTDRIVLAGFTASGNDPVLTRLSNNGNTVEFTTTDTFGGVDEFFAVKVLTNNKIVAGGTTDAGPGAGVDFMLARFAEGGAQEQQRAFNDVVAGADDFLRGIDVQTISGVEFVVVAGFTGTNVNAQDWAAGRVRADNLNTFDTNFNGGNFRVIDFGGDDECTAVAIQQGTKIVLAGETDPAGGGTNDDFALARLNVDGSLDTSFDTDGLATYDFGTDTDDDVEAVAIDPKLFKIVPAGFFEETGAANNKFALARVIGVDRISTAGIYDPTNGFWFLNNRNAGGAPFASFQFGGPGTAAIVGDWDGDGDFTIGIYDQNVGLFLIRNSNSPGAPDFQFFFGGPGTIPVAGDWDGDGRWGIGVYDINTGNWFLRNSLSSGTPDHSFPYGGPGGAPVVGDWNGDGVWTVGVVTTSTGEWLLNNLNRSNAPDIRFFFGSPFQSYVAGDWNGDGISTPGIYAPSTGLWALRNQNSTGGADVFFNFGIGPVNPVAGDYDFPTAAALRSAAGEGPGAPWLASGDLAFIRDAALMRLAAAGVDGDVLALLAQANVEARDLPGDLLGYTFREENRIVIDLTGAGHGWFVDRTPMADEEFATGAAITPEAWGSDLLTTVLHEFGLFAGLADDDGSALMIGTLPLGTRRTDALDAVFGAL